MQGRSRSKIIPHTFYCQEHLTTYRGTCPFCDPNYFREELNFSRMKSIVEEKPYKTPWPGTSWSLGSNI